MLVINNYETDFIGTVEMPRCSTVYTYNLYLCNALFAVCCQDKQGNTTLIDFASDKDHVDNVQSAYPEHYKSNIYKINYVGDKFRLSAIDKIINALKGKAVIELYPDNRIEKFLIDEIKMF